MFEGLERITFSKDWITIILMIVLTLITLLKIKFNDRFTKLFSILYAEKYYNDYLKSKPLIFNKFHMVLFFVIIFNISLLIFNSFKAFYPSKLSQEILFFLQINLLVISYLLVRFFTGYIIAFLFDIVEKQKYVTFLKISDLSLISIVSYPLLVLINYSVGPPHKFLITFTVIAIIILFFLRYFVLVKKEKINFNNLFYFILYLCALEIAPFIVIYKTFVDK